MRKNKYALTEKQFKELRKVLQQRTGAERFEDENIEAAHQVMVGNLSVAGVAEVLNMSRQNLHRVVRDLWAIFNGVEPPSRVQQRQKMQQPKTPKSWVRVAVTLPPEMAKSVQEMEVKARARLAKSKDSEK